jgi:pimeloyl-ACP methyl ester carboxylesterase
MVFAAAWLAKHPTTCGLSFGYFGIGYVGSAALLAAVQRPGRIATVVVNDGVPEQTEEALKRLTMPALVIGGLNRASRERISAGQNWRFAIAGPDETSEVLPQMAATWFATHLEPKGLAFRGHPDLSTKTG